MTSAAVLTAALLLDAVFGEPRWLWSRLPHPAVLMGRAVAWTDRQLNHGTNRRARGTLGFALLAAAATASGAALTALPGGWLVEILLAAILLAQRSLADHVTAVARALRLSTGDARLAVARIVGRDTTGMDGPAISRAAIESAAENLSDGVVAPAFWFLVAGLPGLMLYKLTNTADSMIGYRNARYAEFGWAAARFDDLMNWVPARLTTALIGVTHRRNGKLADIRSDAALHRSPNAGWPEAAMARALGIALSGPRSYHGQMLDFPFVHPKGRHNADAHDIDAATAALWRVWGALLCVTLLMAAI